MRKLKKIVSLAPKNVLDIRYFPTDICNFNCTYCFPGSKDGNYRYSNKIDTIVENFKTLFQFYKVNYDKTKVKLNLAGGGEPTLWPHFGEFCRRIKEESDVEIELSVTTNASRKLRWWKENSKHLDKVNMSFHHEFADIDHSIEVCDYLYGQGINPNALVLIDAEHFEKCKNIVETFKTNSKHPWFIETKPIIQYAGKDNLSYTTEMKDYVMKSLKRIPESEFILKNLDSYKIWDSVALYDDDDVVTKRSGDYITEDLNYFKDWKCNVMLENLCINFTGLLTSSCNVPIHKEHDLNIHDDDFTDKINKFADKLVSFTCPYQVCPCQPDTHITKWKS
jgi:organic radical activating enzyme